ncbi:MAG: NRAMP family divalent metal transporter [Acidimicrobiia bacterium]
MNASRHGEDGPSTNRTRVRGRRHRGSRSWRFVGPGLIAGASDVDPTTVAAIAVVGATTVYGLAWLTLLLFPMLAVIQVIATRVGYFTRADLQTSVTRRYGPTGRWLLLGSVVGVTAITIAADLDAGAAAVGLLFGVDGRWFVVPVGIAALALLFLHNYDQVSRILRYLLVCMFAYGVAAVLAHPHWDAVARASVVPQFRLTSDWTAGALALLGTTLTSYVYVWQTIEEAEDTVSPRAPLAIKQRGAVLGVGFAVVIFCCILVATGATLGVHHIHINTAQDAARALRPVAGRWANDIFAFALLASALVALPVLVATCAYVTGAEFHWHTGLSTPIRSAPRFYATIVAAVALGAIVALSDVNPIQVLFAASVIGGLATPIGLIFLLLIGNNPETMHDHPLPGLLRLAGWAVVFIIAAAAVIAIGQTLTHI